MQTRDLLNLLTLGVLWGASFLFIRVATPEFGAVALIEVRVVTAALVLLPLLILKNAIVDVRRHWKAIAVMGVLHYAIPFCLFAYAMYTLTGGYSAVINASSPLFAGAVAWAWLGERLKPVRIAGLFIGFAGVVILVWDKLSFGIDAAGISISAAVLASACYGFAAVLARKHLAGVSPIAVSAGSMTTAAIVLLPMAFFSWPEQTPSTTGWTMAVILGVFCTAIAFVLYFRLINNVGPGKAITVTFLIPVFAVLFGTIFIGEELTLSMLTGGAVILLGTAMSTGLVTLHRGAPIAEARAQ